MNEIDHINAAINQAKTRPNGIARNKVLSHLHDALFAAKQMPEIAPPPDAPPAGTCICPKGAKDFACPVHGGK